MELIYLWVEKYKNIKEQGFNLSPSFNCSYDMNTTELVVNKNKDYYKSIFPEDIYITAIVGENGSGKSSIVNCIQAQKKVFIVVLEEEELKVYSKNIPIKTSYTQQSLTSEFHKKILYYSMDNKYLRDTNKNVNHIILENTIKLITQNYVKLSNLDFNLFDFDPYYIYYELNFKFIDQDSALTEDGIHSIKSSLGDPGIDTATIITVFDTLKNNDDIYFNYLLSQFYDFFSLVEDTDILERIHPKSGFLMLEKEDLISIIEEKKLHIINEKDFKFLIDNQYTKIKIENLKSILGENYDEFFSFEMNGEIEINYYSKNGATFNSLSHGEKTIYSFFLHLIDNRKEEILLFLDEPDNTLHPNWQKKFLSELIRLIQKLNKKVHMLITMHSPFLLSDIPKENVIYLEKDKHTGLCVDKTNSLDLKPFGANIHTLLSHGFFMKGSLMGEFAKEKIDEILEYLNGSLETTIENNEEAQYRINMIGEPILKKQLQKMLDSKRLSKIDRIDLIEQQMKELSNELEQLKNG